MKCAECRGRGWHVGDCHPREVCGLCCGTGTVACCRDAESVETPTCYVWDCPEHGRAIGPVVRGATAGEEKPTGDEPCQCRDYDNCDECLDAMQTRLRPGP